VGRTTGDRRYCQLKAGAQFVWEQTSFMAFESFGDRDTPLTGPTKTGGSTTGLHPQTAQSHKARAITLFLLTASLRVKRIKKKKKRPVAVGVVGKPVENVEPSDFKVFQRLV